MTATVPPPAACPVCRGDRVVLGHVGALVQYERDCTACRCVVCGQPTGAIGPAECGRCYDAEDQRQARRADR